MSRLRSLSLLSFQTLATVCLLCTTATAQQTLREVPASPSPGDVDVDKSRVYTFVDKTGLGHEHAVEGRLVSGTLLIGAKSAAGKLVFDMRSFDADTNRARKYIGLAGETSASTRAKVTANMKGSEVLHVQKYPSATFQVSSALPTGDTSRQGSPTYELKGNFTLHGVTRPLQVVAEVEKSDGLLHVRGNFVIKQTAFGIKPYSKVFGAIGVADPLRIYGDLWISPIDAVALSRFPLQ